MLTENLHRVRERMHRACARVGRDPAAVTLVAVTKRVAAERVREALACGLAEFGENRVQDAREKISAIASPRARWHLIGHVQRNKVKHAVELFQVIHSVDSFKLAIMLEHQMATQHEVRSQKYEVRQDNPTSDFLLPASSLEVFLQVNVSGEATKFGCAPDEASALARQIGQLPHLRLRGLMTLAPFVENPESARPIFRRLRELRDSVACALRLAPGTLQLSMGMSGDFEVAIEEGADVVRIGRAIFGD